MVYVSTVGVEPRGTLHCSAGLILLDSTFSKGGQKPPDRHLATDLCVLRSVQPDGVLIQADLVAA